MKIQVLRKKIDQLDSRLLKLLNQRAKLSAAVGQYKLATGSQVYAPEREEYLLRMLEEKNEGPLSAPALRAIYREILSTSRACQRPLKIACVGHELSNAWLATRRRFGSSDFYHPIPTFDQALTSLSRKKIDVAVVDRDGLASHLWSHIGKKKNFFVCGDILMGSGSPRDGARDVYFMLSRQPVPPSGYGKTVLLVEVEPGIKTVKNWWSALPELKRHLLFIEKIPGGPSRKKGHWLVELKGHWDEAVLVRLFEPYSKTICRWIAVGSYPEVPNYA